MAQREPDSSASPLAHFGAEVKLARKRKGMTQEDLAALAHIDRSAISRIEAGKEDPPEGFGEVCDEAFPECLGWFSRYLRDAHLWPGGSVIPPWFLPWVEIEQVARELRWWEPTLVPGLLQTPDYAEGVLASWKPYSRDTVKSKLTLRIDRQSVLEKDDPPTVWVLISEAVLDYEIGTATAMAGQLAHLVEMSRRPNITVQVVPAAAHAYAGLSGAFTLATKPNNGEAVHLETATRGMTIHDPVIIGEAAYLFDRLRSDALPQAASQEVITKVGERWSI